MADETRRQPVTDDPGATSAAASEPATARAAEADAGGAAADRRTRAVPAARREAEPAAARRTPWIQVGDRSAGDGSRTSPRMRFDLLQIGAWVIGVALIVGGLVAVARAGFDELGLFQPVVEVGGQPATPLWALLWLVLGALVLSAATGSVDEQRLRITGVTFAIVGLVFLIEPDAFADYLGVTSESGTMLLLMGAVLVGLSFVPPLSIKRPGISEN